MTKIEELLPLVQHAKTAREFGAVVIANVPTKLKRTLALEARDALGFEWVDRTVRYWLKPGCHSDAYTDAHRKTSRLYQKRRRAEKSEIVCSYWRDYNSRRRADDPAFALRHAHKNRIYAALGAAVGNPDKAGRTVDLLGCSAEEYRVYLEGLFEPGMSWDNRGEWHIDHTVPVAAFDLTTEAGQRAAFHYTNTRPMWAAENLSKGSLHDGLRHRHGT